MWVGKEVGIQFINGTTASAPTESFVHIVGLTTSTAVFDGLGKVTITSTKIVIELGLQDKGIEFSSESFSGLRFYDYSQLALMDNDPSSAIPNFPVGRVAHEAIDLAQPTITLTTVQEFGSSGPLFALSRLTSDDNNYYVNFSGIIIPKTNAPNQPRTVTISFEPVPEPTSALLVVLGAVIGLQRRKRK